MSPVERCPIDGDRLWDDLRRYSTLGGGAESGVNRLALGAGDKQTRDRLAEDGAAIGCSVRIDPIGNMYMRLAGKGSDRAPIQIGSHLDSGVWGGRYDGVYGACSSR